MGIWRVRWAAVVLLVHVCWAASARAESLTQLLEQVLRFDVGLERSPRFRRDLQRVIIGFQQSAVRTANYLATATTPGFTYAYDPELGTFTRTETARGPIYVEPADTIGRGQFSVGMAYQYSNFNELDGQSLEDALDQLREVRGTDFLDIRTRKLEFRSQLFSASGTYGITDRWNVNLLVPVLVTALELNATSVLLVPGARPFSNTVVERDTKLGVGDTLLRTKYRPSDQLGFQLAYQLSLRIPSGNEDNFQGLGDVTLTPLLVVQRTFGPHAVQANLGAEVNAGDVGQSRARYALGTTLQAVRPLSFTAHVVGNSGFAAYDFTEGDVRGTVARTDIVDAVMGLEVTLAPKVVAYVGAIVPLNDDGLRAAVVPTAWLGGRF